jgi:CheY-like chemotaxis protein
VTPPLLLLVDDAPELGVIVRALGKRAGCTVEVRQSVAEAWDWLTEQTPNLVLLDLNLVGPSGIELCQRVRASASLAALPIALFGQWGLPGDVAAALDAGVDFVFCKDLVCRADEWQQRLHEILALDHGRIRPWSLGLVTTGEESATPAEGYAMLRRAMRHASIRWLSPGILRGIVCRALRQVFAPSLPPSELSAWLSPDGLSSNAVRPPVVPRPEVTAALALSLSEWFWRLLGTEASAPVRTFLAAAVPGSQTMPPPS